MKKIVFVVVFFMGVGLINAQSGLTEVTSALKSGNAKALSVYFHSSIDLTIKQTEGTYSKSQAEYVIHNFFNSNKPTAFKVNHSGSSSDRAKYVIGSLESSGGTYRVYMLFKSISGKELIQTMSFESN